MIDGHANLRGYDVRFGEDTAHGGQPSAQAERVGQVRSTARHPLVWLFGLVGFGMSAFVGYFSQQLSDPTSFPIRKVMVEGDFKHLAPDYVQGFVSSVVDAGFFAVDVAEIRERLLDEPWVDDVSVQRVWPDTLRVGIREQQPVAYWGEHALLNAEADIFVPASATMPANLVLLNGPVGSEAEVLLRYRAMQTQLARHGLRIRRVDLSARRAWVIEVEGGARIVIGRSAIEERLARLDRGFEHALKPRWPEVRVVDLRYTNGFAVRERAPASGNG